MYYVAKLVKKERPFQRAYTVDGNYIYITNTNRGKKKFLKSGITNAVFGEEFKKDKIMGEALIPMRGYDRSFVLGFLEDMIRCITSFFKMQLPVDEIAIYSPMPEDILKTAVLYAKMVTIVGEEGESQCLMGVTVRRVKRLRVPPCLIITEGERRFSPIFKVPVIDLGGEVRTKETLSYETIAFECPFFPFEIGAEEMMYIINQKGDVPYSVTSLRKKLPPLFVLRQFLS